MDTITLAGLIEAKLRAVKDAGFTQIIDAADRANLGGAVERRETARHARVFPGEGAHSDALGDLIRAIDELG